MDTRPIAVGLAALFVAALLPSAEAEAEPFHDMIVVDHTTNTHVKGVLGVGLIDQAGVFDLRHWNFEPESEFLKTREVRVWAVWAGGVFVDGFALTVCNDRNDDRVCTNARGANDKDPYGQRAHDDQIHTQYSNPPLVGEPCKQDNPDRPPDEEDPGKDSKDCGDPTDAEVRMCLIVDTIFTEEPQRWDDLAVFIENWADDPVFQNPKENTGTGVSAGTYEVYLEYGRWGCEPTD